jgi:hypothetical protein
MNAEEQFKFVAEFNWDDSLEPIEQILDSPVCVFETALLAFWRLEGPWYYTGVQRHHHYSSLIDRSSQAPSGTTVDAPVGRLPRSRRWWVAGR